jgi:hypothetical protein
MKLNVDVIHINRLLHKIDKFWKICLFCDETHVREADFCVLVMTNAANVGIDKASVALQIQFDWPCNLATYFLEQGRGSRQKGITSTCILYADLSLYVFLVLQLLNRHTDKAVDAGSMAECNRYNLAILPRLQQRQVNTST